MSNYELYQKVVEASKSSDEGLFNAAARNWIESADNADFQNEEANELFAAAKRHCATWRNKAINGRVAKMRMIDCVRDIVGMNLENPYPETYSVVDDIVKDIKENDESVEKVHILGVVPDTHEGFEKFDNQKVVEKPTEEAAPTEKRLFGKRNKR